jgi:DNA-binding NarL/FixJ family response regulator
MAGNNHQKTMASQIRVSLVEDHEDVRDNIAGYLNAADGFKCVSSYPSGEEALARLPADAPDVVLMDINLGGISGIDCVRQLKPLLPKSQIVMLTVFEDADLIFSALAAGASGYLLKRMPPAQLLEAILEVHGGGAPMSASIARKVVQSFQSGRSPGEQDAELSTREREVLNGLAEGYVYKQIADQLGVSIHTLRNYIRRIYEKLHVHTRSQAVAKYYRQ